MISSSSTSATLTYGAWHAPLCRPRQKKYVGTLRAVFTPRSTFVPMPFAVTVAVQQAGAETRNSRPPSTTASRPTRGSSASAAGQVGRHCPCGHPLSSTVEGLGRGLTAASAPPGASPDARLDPYYLHNLLGNPVETAQLVFGDVLELTHRDLAILRATACGRVRVSLSCEPDIFVDGLAFSDQPGARALIHAGMIRPTRPGRIGEQVPARLTDTGGSVLANANLGAPGTAA